MRSEKLGIVATTPDITPRWGKRWGKRWCSSMMFMMQWHILNYVRVLPLDLWDTLVLNICCCYWPMLPITAKGEAMIWSATAAIKYPPLAATSSTQTINFKPLFWQETITKLVVHHNLKAFAINEWVREWVTGQHEWWKSTLIRFNWAAARPYPVTVPPPLLSRTITTSPLSLLDVNNKALISSRRFSTFKCLC